MECCNSNLEEFICPRCAFKGKPVKLITIQSLLLEPLLKQIKNEDTYMFCKNPKCDVVYFSLKKKIFYKKDLKVKTTIKSSDLDVKTCYCFNVTKGDILDEIKKTKNCTVVDVIKRKMKDPGCFCESSNPEGSCCLANNIAFIKEVQNDFK